MVQTTVQTGRVQTSARQASRAQTGTFSRVPTARILREAMGPGFQSGPADRAMAMLAAASITDRRTSRDAAPTRLAAWRAVGIDSRAA